MEGRLLGLPVDGFFDGEKVKMGAFDGRLVVGRLLGLDVVGRLLGVLVDGFFEGEPVFGRIEGSRVMGEALGEMDGLCDGVFVGEALGFLEGLDETH